MKLLLLLCVHLGLVVSLFAQQQPAKESITAPHMQITHRELLEEYLRFKPKLRLATIERDSSDDQSGLQAMREVNGSSYHPFYAVGDFNGDTSEDFAAVLIDLRKPVDNYAVVIFNGRANGTYPDAPSFVSYVEDMETSGLISVGYGRGVRLIVNVFQSDVCTGIKALGATYKIAACPFER